MDPNRVTYFAETDYRNERQRFGIKAKDRNRHMYIIGMTGMGKSTLLENLAIQDIANGEGFCFIDPHGGSADKLLNFIPESRIKDVVYFAPFDLDFPVAFNPMESTSNQKQRFLIAAGLMSTFKKIWADAWSARMEYILNNTLLALLEYPDATLLGVNRMLAEKDFRKKVVENVSDPSVKAFWIEEFGKYSEKYMQEAGAAIQNKIGQFTANPVIRNIIGQPHSSFDIREAMDNKKILLVNLSKGRIGEQNANLLGGMFITKLYLAAMSRAEATHNELAALPEFYLYVDEFQSFASDSFADILAEARKYKLNLIIAHQYVAQMSEAVRDAVFGNVGTMVVFRVGATDAELFSKEFANQFSVDDVVSLGLRQVYLRLMIDGVGSRPFSATTFSYQTIPEVSNLATILQSSRDIYAHPKDDVEKAIATWYQPVEAPRRESALPKDFKDQGMTAPAVRPRENSFAPQASRPTTVSKPATSPIARPVVPLVKPAPSAPETVQGKPAPVTQKHMPFRTELANALASFTNTKNTEKVVEKSVLPAPVVTTVRPVAPKPAPSIAEPEVRKPFKDALAQFLSHPEITEEVTPVVPTTTISMKELAPKTKGGSEHNLSALRDLLKTVVQKETPIEKITSSETITSEKQEDKKKFVVENTTEKTSSQTVPKEVPEDVLRKVLE